MRHLILIGMSLLVSGCSKSGGDGGKTTDAPPEISPTAVTDSLKGPQVTEAASQGKNQNRKFDKHLEAPSDMDIIMVYFDHTGLTPPIEEWAEESTDVKMASEFDRQTVKSRLISNYQSQRAANTNVGSIRVITSSQFSEYSPEYGEYYLAALSPGTYFTYAMDRSFGREKVPVKVTMSNIDKAYRWKISPERAKAVFNENRARNVTVALDIALTGAHAEGNTGVISGTVRHVSIMGAYDKKLIAEYDVTE